MKMKMKWLSAVMGVCMLAGAARAQNADAAMSFMALGDHPYGPAAQTQAPYEGLIEAINAQNVAFSVHVGDFKSGSTLCNDAEFDRQLANFQRFSAPVVYTPGDNEWTDCHRANNGAFDPLERLSVLRQRFFPAGKSLGARPMAVESQASLMPAHATFVENLRWHQGGVMFATAHIVGSNNNLEARDPRGAGEFFQRDAANVAWIQSAFEQARQRDAKALVLAFQADVFESRNLWEDFPGHSGFRRTIGETLLPLAKAWGRPVLVVHGDSHQFKIDQPFTLDKKPVANVTRLIVPGAQDLRAVRVDVLSDGRWGFQLVHPVKR